MKVFPTRLLCGLVCFLGPLLAQTVAPPTAIFPLKDVRPGQHGVGRTVFQGEKIEEFDVEVLGVLENLGPKQSIILGRLSGGPLERTGVMQGMSGSPVYIDGKLVGAVALAFPFSKEPIAGIRPIEEMIATAPKLPPTSPAKTQTAQLAWNAKTVTQLLPPRETPAANDQSKLIDIATPISFSGFTKSTLDFFAPQLRQLGLEPRQALSGGGKPDAASSNPAELKPGSMITVQLVSGDLAIGADGTVTHVDGRRVYAFGHPFLSVGSTDLPFAKASVITLMPNVNTSFKISAAKEWLGSITGDNSTAISGEIGRKPDLLPVTIDVLSPSTAPQRYKLQMVNDRALTPFLLQMAVYSTIEATQRTLGSSSYRMSGQIRFRQPNAPPIELDNMYAGDFAVPLQASLGAALPLSYLLQSNFDALQPKEIALTLQAYNEKKQVAIDQVWASKREVRPGESVDIMALMVGENGRESTQKFTYKVPVGANLGPLYFTVADATTSNLTDYALLNGANYHSPRQVVSLINGVRGNRKGYLRVWRADPSYQVQGESIVDPPPSLALILAKPQAGYGGTSLTPNAKLAEFEFTAGDEVISGSKTIQVEVKE